MDPLPVRIELFDDEIDSIRLFDPVNQRSFDPIQEYTLSPGSEVMLTKEALEHGKKLCKPISTTVSNGFGQPIPRG
jgi:transcription-repair coupling factor (superfamily II helicase)